MNYKVSFSGVMVASLLALSISSDAFFMPSGPRKKVTSPSKNINTRLSVNADENTRKIVGLNWGAVWGVDVNGAQKISFLDPIYYECLKSKSGDSWDKIFENEEKAVVSSYLHGQKLNHALIKEAWKLVGVKDKVKEFDENKVRRALTSQIKMIVGAMRKETSKNEAFRNALLPEEDKMLEELRAKIAKNVCLFPFTIMMVVAGEPTVMQIEKSGIIGVKKVDGGFEMKVMNFSAEPFEIFVERYLKEHGYDDISEDLEEVFEEAVAGGDFEKGGEIVGEARLDALKEAIKAFMEYVERLQNEVSQELNEFCGISNTDKVDLISNNFFSELKKFSTSDALVSEQNIKGFLEASKEADVCLNWQNPEFLDVVSKDFPVLKYLILYGNTTKENEQFLKECLKYIRSNFSQIVK